jgi:ankyrin repeat protein
MENRFKNLDNLVLNALADNMDDRTLFTFCKTDKYFNSKICKDEKFWLRRLRSKYPLLEQFKNKNESYRDFFLKMSKYNYKLEEEFEIPYIPTDRYNPEEFYLENVVNNKNQDIFTDAMYYAILAKNLEIVKKLIEKIDDIEIPFVLDWVAGDGDLKTLKYLLDKKGIEPNYNLLANAAAGGKLEILKYLIDKNIPINYLILSYAASNGHLEMVKYLIEEKGLNNIQKLEDVLTDAASNGKLDIVKYLIEERGVKNIPEDALEFALARDHLEVYNYLKEFK